MSALLSLIPWHMILPALVPAATDVARGLVAKVTGGAGAQPQNVAERVQLMQAETARLQALGELDKPEGQISQWVANLRASFRYIAIGTVELAALVAVLAGIQGPNVAVLLELAGAGMSFIIGERMYLAIGGRNR